jgi:phosphate starvation-inducible PhoH-like protein
MTVSAKTISRRERKQARRKQKVVINQSGTGLIERNNLNLKTIKPLTPNQEKVFNSYYYGNHLFLSGSSGTGKTFISFYLALKDILEDIENYKKIVMIRSTVPTRDQGFMPGNQKQKQEMYESPYYQICSDLFGRDDAYDILKNKGIIEFTSTSFLRGTTFRNCIVIFDEFQSTTLHEFSSVITRMSDNVRLLICGDIVQNDLIGKEKYDCKDSLRILEKMKCIDKVTFTPHDIVRGKLVKEFILAKESLGLI